MAMPKEVRQEIAAISAAMDYDAAQKKYGVSQLIGEKDYSPIERTWIRGSLDVTGMKSGYTEGAASVIPESAWFRVMARLGPGMDTVKTHKQIMAHVEKNVPWGVITSYSIHYTKLYDHGRRLAGDAAARDQGVQHQ